MKCFVTLSAKGGLVTGRIFLGLHGGIHGQRTNSVLDMREKISSLQQWVPREGPKTWLITETPNKGVSDKSNVYFLLCKQEA